MGLEEVGEARQSKSGRGIVIELRLPSAIFTNYLVMKRSDLLELCQPNSKRYKVKVSLITGKEDSS